MILTEDRVVEDYRIQGKEIIAICCDNSEQHINIEEMLSDKSNEVVIDWYLLGAQYYVKVRSYYMNIEYDYKIDEGDRIYDYSLEHAIIEGHIDLNKYIK